MTASNSAGHAKRNDKESIADNISNESYKSKGSLFLSQGCDAAG